MGMSNRYLVYSTKTHSVLRVLLTLLVLFQFFVATQLGYLWLYCVSVGMLAIVTCVLSILYSSVSFSEQGIRLRYGFWKTYQLSWEEVQCCGTFSLTILGASAREDYLYFSKKPVPYAQIAARNTLPSPSDDFLFLSKQKEAIGSIERFWNRGKVKCLGSSTYQEYPQQGKEYTAFFCGLLGVFTLICVAAYALSSDARWIFAAAASLIVLFGIPRMKP